MPLYPQYAAATTATACDEAFRALMRTALAAGACGWRRPITRIPSTSTRWRPRSAQHLAGLDFEPEALIASFHGMPQRYLESGDPYHCQCQKTSRLLRERLGWAGERWHTTFQSRFGNEAWLQPYTIETVERLARSGVKRLAVVAPGFSADCLETLEELDMENRAAFLGQRRREVHLRPLPQRQPAGHARHRAHRAPRADGLGLSRSARTPLGCHRRAAANPHKTSNVYCMPIHLP